MAILKRHWLAIFAFVFLTGYAGWVHFGALRETAPYTCQKTETIKLQPRWMPHTDGLKVTYLELYIGGWVSDGALTLDSDVFEYRPGLVRAGAIDFKADAKSRSRMVAFSRIGEWYSSDLKLTFRPSPGAHCHVKIAYRLFGRGEMVAQILSRAPSYLWRTYF